MLAFPVLAEQKVLSLSKIYESANIFYLRKVEKNA